MNSDPLVASTSRLHTYCSKTPKLKLKVKKASHTKCLTTVEMTTLEGEFQDSLCHLIPAVLKAASTPGLQY
jgi:hypothetical protein